MLRLPVLLLMLFGAGVSACAQQPFFTDDADVTDRGAFIFELSNQFSLLQDTAFPSQQQNALVYQLNYGLRHGLELRGSRQAVRARDLRVCARFGRKRPTRAI
jgi:hypothetical protein